MLRREPSGECGPAAGRAAERRRGPASLLAAIASVSAPPRDPRRARERLEEELRKVLQARAVLVREEPPMPPAGSNVICCHLPSWTTEGRARLEAIFDTPRNLDPWTSELLDGAAQLAGLLLDLERVAGRRPPARRTPDGAAPLIGSSDAIRRVRDRIERIAPTEFSILIEGASRR